MHETSYKKGLKNIYQLKKNLVLFNKKKDVHINTKSNSHNKYQSLPVILKIGSLNFIECVEGH